MRRRTTGRASRSFRGRRETRGTPPPMVGSTPLKHFPPQLEMTTGIAEPADGRLPAGARKPTTHRRMVLQVSGVTTESATVTAKKTAAAVHDQVFEMMPTSFGDQRYRPGEHRFHNHPAPAFLDP